MEPTRTIALQRFASGTWSETPDDLAVEEPLEIRVEGQSIAVVMRTPGHDRELAAGFLYAEGVIESARDLFDLTTCVPSGERKGQAVDAGLARPSAFDPARFSRHVFTSASCGICGQTSIDEVLKRRAPLSLEDGVHIAPELLLRLPAVLSRHQQTFQRTGGLHACALFTLQGELLQAREDVGRHNALDKLVGWALLEKRLPLAQCILLLSGRASFEMVQKAHAAGVPIIAAISAPSSLAVELARESNVTLAGFVRGETMNVYCGAERLRVAG